MMTYGRAKSRWQALLALECVVGVFLLSVLYNAITFGQSVSIGKVSVYVAVLLMSLLLLEIPRRRRGALMRVLQAKWEALFEDASAVINWAKSLEYFERTALRILWEGEKTSHTLLFDEVLRRFAYNTFTAHTTMRASMGIFADLVERGVVLRDEEGTYRLSPVLVESAKESHPLDSFFDPTVHVPVFRGRAFPQTT